MLLAEHATAMVARDGELETLEEKCRCLTQQLKAALHTHVLEEKRSEKLQVECNALKETKEDNEKKQHADDRRKRITDACDAYVRRSTGDNSDADYVNLIDSFLLEFSPVIQTLSKISKNVVLAGDFNIDLLKLNSNTKYQEFYDTLAEFDFLPIITLPTRISKRNATLIDHMYCKSPNPLTISESGILATQISDHMATFVALNFNINKNYKHLETVCTRSFTGNKMNCFLGELENINWPQIFDHDTAADPLITYDQQFSTKLDEMINLHFPLKVVKFNKHKHKKSKWMTHTLLTEIKKRDELYRSLNSTKPETYNYTVKEAELKMKVKEVRKLKRETKAEYYNLEFNKSKNDIKKTWETIAEVMSKSKIQKIRSQLSSILMKNR